MSAFVNRLLGKIGKPIKEDKFICRLILMARAMPYWRWYAIYDRCRYYAEISIWHYLHLSSLSLLWTQRNIKRFLMTWKWCFTVEVNKDWNQYNLLCVGTCKTLIWCWISFRLAVRPGCCMRMISTRRRLSSRSDTNSAMFSKNTSLINNNIHAHQIKLMDEKHICNKGQAKYGLFATWWINTYIFRWGTFSKESSICSWDFKDIDSKTLTSRTLVSLQTIMYSTVYTNNWKWYFSLKLHSLYTGLACKNLQLLSRISKKSTWRYLSQLTFYAT